jgi:hypothetical protein
MEVKKANIERKCSIKSVVAYLIVYFLLLIVYA